MDFTVGFGAQLIIPAYAGSTRRCRWLSCPGRDHPRIRGEHNQEDPHPRRSRGSSPHTRGAPTSSHWPVTLSRIIPAYAGSTAPLVAGPLAPMGSSPHTRGARGAEGVDRAVGRIIPAYAGSTGSTAVSGSATWDHPRIRGEHSHPTSKGLSSQGSSPHTRGAPSTCRFWRRRSRIIPAYAGSTGSTCSAGRWLADHPRIRGEHRDAVAECERGHRIIPAYAGSTMCGRRTAGTSGDHPRIRGEHGLCDIGPAATPGSSPHTRGAPEDRRRSGRRPRIIPAYAGSTRRRRRDPRWPWDHPRIRGEHIRRLRQYLPREGSSPHTRGARKKERMVADEARIIPAYAGSTLNSTGDIRFATDHPRIRGEHNQEDPHPRRSRGSSPHTRGARDDAPQERTGCGIIPAYAGSTDFLGDAFATVGDHPRIRGEHPSRSVGAGWGGGSSPHTRGARLISWCMRRGPGIIPAYAGSTPSPCYCGAARPDHPRIRGEHVGGYR